LLALAVSVLLNLLAPAAAYRDDMPGGPYRYDGMFDPPGNSFGYFDPEQAPGGATYRWTTAEATTTFPYAANAGRHVRIAVRMGAFQATEADSIDVELRLNGTAHARFSAWGDFRTYEAEVDTTLVPNPYLAPAHVQVDLLSETRSTPQDPRELGVAVDWIEARPARSRTEIVVEAAIWALAVGLVALVGLTRLSRGWALAFALLALATLAAVHLNYMPRSIPVPVEVVLAGLGWVLAVLLAPKRWPVLGIALAALLVWLVLAGRALGEWQMDDAYISYRYAWNLVHDRGLVYNVGEAVEGYTNFLWTLLAAAAIRLGWDPASFAQTANIAVSQCLVAVTFYLSASLSRGARPERNPWPLAAAALLAVDVSLVYYGARGSGMESAFFGLLVLLAAALLWHTPAALREWRRVAAFRAAGGLALALAALTRPEGLLVAALLVGLRLWQDRQAGGDWAKLLVAAAVPFLVVVAPYELWRISFYGYLFPNTFYAKTGTSLALLGRGLVYAGDFALAHWLVALPVLLGAVFALLLAPRFLRGLRNGRSATEGPGIGLLGALAALAAVYTLYIVSVGGDHFPAYRFFVPLLAPVVLVAQEAARAGLGYLIRRNTGIARYAVPVAALLIVVYAGMSLLAQRPGDFLGDRAKRETTALERWGSAGLWLRDNTPPGATTAAQAAGAIAYYSDRTVVDMLGLTDPHIAHLEVEDMGSSVAGHEKRDPAYVLGREPGYILATWEEYFSALPGAIASRYDYETVRSPTGTPVKWLHRKDLAGAR
jgi:arabinofuranosyltransferase